MNDFAIELKGVGKAYPFFSLQDIHLEVPRGQIMGLIGPNGAGKSTTIRILMGLVRQDCGEVRVLGRAMPDEQVAAKWDIGFASEDMRLYEGMTFEWHMNFVRSIYANWDAAYAQVLLKRFGLRAEQKIKELSHGQRVLWQTRVGAGSALGGSQWGSAFDGGKVYVAISDIGIGGVADPKAPGGFRLTLDPKKGGGLHALDPATGQVVWSTKPDPCADGRTDCWPAQSGAVTAIPGVVLSGSMDGHLRAYAAGTGKVVWDVDTAKEFPAVNGGTAHGGSMDSGGPIVVDGMVLVYSGYGQFGGMAGNALLVYSVEGR